MERPPKLNVVPERITGHVAEIVACLLLKVFQSVPVRHPVTPLEALVQVRIDADPPMTEMGFERDSAPEDVRVVVAALPNKAGVPLVVVQYAKFPAVSFVDVPTVPLPPAEPFDAAVTRP